MRAKLGEERRRRILEHARSAGSVEVTELAGQLEVASETVRRDLKALEGHGLIRRTHGGAYPVESAGYETNLAFRSESWTAEKRRIAAAAVQQLDDAETVFIDEGVTPQFIAEGLLHVRRPLTAVTSSLASAALLSESASITVILLGGRVRGRTQATVDHWAIDMLSGLVIDLAFLGANGISLQHGLTTPDPAVAAVKRTVRAVSRRLVFSGVHTKFGVASFCKVAEVADLEAIITDTNLSATIAHRFAAMGPQVIRA